MDVQTGRLVGGDDDLSLLALGNIPSFFAGALFLGRYSYLPDGMKIPAVLLAADALLLSAIVTGVFLCFRVRTSRAFYRGIEYAVFAVAVSNLTMCYIGMAMDMANVDTLSFWICHVGFILTVFSPLLLAMMLASKLEKKVQD